MILIYDQLEEKITLKIKRIENYIQMKKITGFLLLIILSNNLQAQKEEQAEEYKRFFAGGTLVLGYSGGTYSQFTIGGNPEIGYSLSKNFDAGICFNTIYITIN